MGFVRYGKAVHRLQMIAERCQRVSGLWDEAPPLIGAYAFGEILDAPEQLDSVQVALVLNHLAEDLTWCARPTAEPLRLPPPDPRREDEQLAFELEASRAYLRLVEDRYWDREWRAEHRGSGSYPESHLWDAVHC